VKYFENDDDYSQDSKQEYDLVLKIRGSRLGRLSDVGQLITEARELVLHHASAINDDDLGRSRYGRRKGVMIQYNTRARRTDQPTRSGQYHLGDSITYSGPRASATLKFLRQARKI
jgi:hypothetical protein